MDYKRISQWRAGRVANILGQPLTQKAETLREELRVMVELKLIEFVPKEIMALWEDYPQHIVRQEYITISLGKHTEYVYPKIPSIYNNVNVNEALRADADFSKALDEQIEAIAKLDTQHRLLVKRVRCTVFNLKTYAKLKSEFPEAYRVLVEQVDEEAPENESLCDSVENIRAELTHITPKTKK